MFQKLSTVFVLYHRPSCSNNQGVHQKSFIARYANRLWHYLNKADRNMLLKNKKSLHYSKVRGGNQLSFCVKRNVGGSISAEQINSVRHKKALGRRLGYLFPEFCAYLKVYNFRTLLSLLP